VKLCYTLLWQVALYNRYKTEQQAPSAYTHSGVLDAGDDLELPTVVTLGVVGARTRVEALRVAGQTLLAHWLTGGDKT